MSLTAWSPASSALQPVRRQVVVRALVLRALALCGRMAAGHSGLGGWAVGWLVQRREPRRRARWFLKRPRAALARGGEAAVPGPAGRGCRPGLWGCGVGQRGTRLLIIVTSCTKFLSISIQVWCGRVHFSSKKKHEKEHGAEKEEDHSNHDHDHDGG